MLFVSDSLQFLPNSLPQLGRTMPANSQQEFQVLLDIASILSKSRMTMDDSKMRRINLILSAQGLGSSPAPSSSSSSESHSFPQRGHLYLTPEARQRNRFDHKMTPGFGEKRAGAESKGQHSRYAINKAPVYDYNKNEGAHQDIRMKDSHWRYGSAITPPHSKKKQYLNVQWDCLMLLSSVF